jgi:2-polyprenyl-3-methyl-5-hydroxy-6-metoxy-1,4-benzoquinol methylase
LNRLAALGTRQGRLLDVGCLWGSFLGYAHERGFDVTGIEPFGKAATYVKEVLKLNASQGTLRSAALPAGSFDVVTILDVIEHMTDPVTELKEVYRVTKPGGLLIVSTPDVGSLIHQEEHQKLCRKCGLCRRVRGSARLQFEDDKPRRRKHPMEENGVPRDRDRIFDTRYQ